MEQIVCTFVNINVLRLPHQSTKLRHVTITDLKVCPSLMDKLKIKIVLNSKDEKQREYSSRNQSGQNCTFIEIVEINS